MMLQVSCCKACTHDHAEWYLCSTLNTREQCGRMLIVNMEHVLQCSRDMMHPALGDSSVHTTQVQ